MYGETMTSRTINFIFKCLKVTARQAKVIVPYPPKCNTLICIPASNCRLFIALDSYECLQVSPKLFSFFAAVPSSLEENLTDPQINKTHTLQIKCCGIWLRQSTITENRIGDDKPWYNRLQFVGSKLRSFAVKWFQPSLGFVFFGIASVMQDTWKKHAHTHKWTQGTENQVRRVDLGIRSMNITTRRALCGTVSSR
jgi:hypothetical protein